MKPLVLLAACLMLGSCEAVPTHIESCDGGKGYIYMRFNEQWTDCKPCDGAWRQHEIEACKRGGWKP